MHSMKIRPLRVHSGDENKAETPSTMCGIASVFQVMDTVEPVISGHSKKTKTIGFQEQ